MHILGFINKNLPILFVALLLLMPFPAHSSSDEANEFVKDLGDKVLAIIKNKKFNDSKKEAELISLFEQHVDTKWMSNFVLGRYSRSATKEQLEEYQKLYHTYLIYSYVPKFKRYTGESFYIIKVDDNGDDEYMVRSKLERSPSEPEVRVDYRLYQNGSGFKVRDIVGEGVSLINTQRSDFGGMISQKGMGYFIEKLEFKVKNLTS